MSLLWRFSWDFPGTFCELAAKLAADAATALHHFDFLLTSVFVWRFFSYCYLSCPRLKIVDDDIDWKEMVNVQEEVEEEEDEIPVVSP